MAGVRDVVCSQHASRPWWITSAYLMLVVVLAGSLAREVVAGSEPMEQGGHAEASFNLAINGHFCGTTNRLSTARSIAWELTARPDLMDVPVREILQRQAGSVPRYCATVTRTFRNNENSLMWLMRGILQIRPSGSPAAVGRWLAGLRVAMLLVFAFALLRAGSSIWLATAAVLVGCAILRAVGIRYTLYPFLLTLPLLLTAYYTIGTTLRVTESPWRLGAFTLGAGLLTGFAANVRTSHTAIYATLFVLFLATVVRRWDDASAPSSRRRALFIAAVSFVAGYLAFDQVFIGPLRRSVDPGVTNYTYHAVAHSLVIGLGYPDTELSRREGIKWDDQVGFALARRAVPGVTYLGPDYEAALLKYYTHLWSTRTGLMLDAYWQKLRSAGTEVFLSAALVGSQLGLPRAPGEWLHRVTNGVFLVCATLAMFVLAFWAYLRTPRPLMLTIAMVGLCGLFTVIESFLTLSVFVAMYYSFLLFALFFASVVLVQVGIDWLAERVVPTRHVFRVEAHEHSR